MLRRLAKEELATLASKAACADGTPQKRVDLPWLTWYLNHAVAWEPLPAADAALGWSLGQALELLDAVAVKQEAGKARAQEGPNSVGLAQTDSEVGRDIEAALEDCFLAVAVAVSSALAARGQFGPGSVAGSDGPKPSPRSLLTSLPASLRALFEAVFDSEPEPLRHLPPATAATLAIWLDRTGGALEGGAAANRRERGALPLPEWTSGHPWSSLLGASGGKAGSGRAMSALLLELPLASCLGPGRLAATMAVLAPALAPRRRNLPPALGCPGVEENRRGEAAASEPSPPPPPKRPSRLLLAASSASTPVLGAALPEDCRALVASYLTPKRLCRLACAAWDWRGAATQGPHAQGLWRAHYERRWGAQPDDAPFGPPRERPRGHQAGPARQWPRLYLSRVAALRRVKGKKYKTPVIEEAGPVPPWPWRVCPVLGCCTVLRSPLLQKRHEERHAALYLSTTKLTV